MTCGDWRPACGARRSAVRSGGPACPHSAPRTAHRGNAGFTLVEVAFSLALVAGAVVVMLALFPMGIRTQQQARYKIIAAAKAMEMLEWYRDGAIGGTINDGNDLDKEGVFPWDTAMPWRSFAPDLDTAINNLRGGLKPLPLEIAQRLDSDNDEIRRLIDQGGYVYYCAPTYLTGFLDGHLPNMDANWLGETRKLIVGVVGLPQQNSILYHPSVKVGPYHDHYPSPPTSVNEVVAKRPNQRGADNAEVRWILLDALCRDARIGQVVRSDATYEYEVENLDADGTVRSGALAKVTRPFGYKPFTDLCLTTNRIDGKRNAGVLVRTSGRVEELAITGDSRVPTFTVIGSGNWDDLADSDPRVKKRFKEARLAAAAYLVAALWYAQQAGLPVPVIANTAALDAFVTAHSGDDAPLRVLAMRYLAHAAATFTRFFTPAELAAGVDLGRADFGLPADSPPMAGTLLTQPLEMDGVRGGIVRLGDIQAWHELALRMAVKHADRAGPYNWGAPRPLNRQTMMDHPLCQLDLWSPPIAASLPGYGGSTAFQAQWRAVYPQAIRFPGVPQSYPGRIVDTNNDGVVDGRDQRGAGDLHAYPARRLDVGANGPQADPIAADPEADGVLDENDHPVPASATTWQPAVGPVAHFNLTQRFEPHHRCRQIVVWAVDWQSYEDFETAPSVPQDASRYPLIAPYAHAATAAPNAFTNEWVQRSPAVRQGDSYYRAGVLFSECIRNPEHVLLFRLPQFEPVGSQRLRKTQPVMTVSDINNFGGGDIRRGSQTDESNPFTGESPDMTVLTQGTLAPDYIAPDQAGIGHNRMIFMGRYGANRNGVVAGSISGIGAAGPDGIGNLAPSNLSRFYATGWVDGGTVPRSTHLRATTVCRFNYYDGRVSGALRN